MWKDVNFVDKKTGPKKKKKKTGPSASFLPLPGCDHEQLD